MSSPNLINYLFGVLEDTRENHPSFKLMNHQIDDYLFPQGFIKFEPEALDSNEELKTITEIVDNSWKKGKRNHLMIEGEGGIGKTVTLLSLPDKLAPCPVPAIYIPLHELRGDGNDDMIEKYIKNTILDEEEDLYHLLKTLRKTEWDNAPQLLLLLDGFNEISSDKLRGNISQDIERWSRYPGVQIITSSRYDIHNYVALQSDFSKIKLKSISKAKVLEYLSKVKVSIPNDPELLDLITNPLLLTLFIKTETIRRDRYSTFASYKETKNAGTLIWNYLQCELWRFRDNPEYIKACVVAMEFIAPRIAWNMQQYAGFVLDEEDFLDQMEEAYDLLKNHFSNTQELPKHIKITVKQSSGQLPEFALIRDLLQEQLSLFNRQERKDSDNNLVVEYRLMHQQFRDALAALHLINSSYLFRNTLPSEWESSIDFYVMRFVADLISDKEAMGLWELNRKTITAIEDATRNQLRLQGLLHNNNYSHLDFSGLDLGNISLYPYRYSNATIKLPSQPERMEKTILSDKTFSPEGHEDYVLAVAVTLDGERIVSGSKDNTIRIWNLKTGEPVGRPLVGHEGHVLSIALASDRKTIISGSADNTIRIWNLETKEPVGAPLRGHNGPVLTVAVTPDGKRIISGSADKTIRVWDLETGKTIGKPFIGHENMVRSISMTLDGKYIVSGSYDNTIRVWNSESGKPKGNPIRGHNGPVLAVAVTLDGKRIVSGSYDKTIRIWDLETGRPLGKPIEGHEGPLSAIILTQNCIVSGSYDKTIRVWNMKTGLPLGEPIKGHKGPLSAISLTRDEKRIVSGSYDKTIRVWNLETHNLIGRPIEGHTVGGNVIAITPDGKRIIIGTANKTTRVWDLKNDKTIGMPIEGYDCAPTAYALAKGGKRTVIGYVDNTIRTWDLNTGEPIGKPFEGHEGPIRAIAVTQDGKCLVSGSDDSTIRVWNMKTGKPIGQPFEGHDGPVLAVAVADTPDGQYIVSGSYDNSICIWNMESGIMEMSISKHESGVNAIAITASTSDEFRIVSRSYDHTIRIWDFWTCNPIEKINEGREGPALAIAATTMSNIRLVSVDEDNTIHIWDLMSRNPINTPSYEFETGSFDTTQDGLRIISGLDDKALGTKGIIRHVKTINIHPLSFYGLDFSKAIISTPELKETLRQNGAIV